MLILASGSPRRREILSMLGYCYTVQPANCDESFETNVPEQAVQILSSRKANAVFCGKEDVVLAADTIVAINGKILGKPANPAEAARMLRLLSGKTHQVYTGMTLRTCDHSLTECIKSAVTFAPLTPPMIEAYLKTGEPFDKAGAYAVQGKGAAFIRRIDGDFFAVMGLSAYRMREMLETLKKQTDESISLEPYKESSPSI